MIDEWYVIANPIAGKGQVKSEWPIIEEKLMSSLPIGEVEFTAYRGHAINLARQAVQAGFKKIIAIGGDGTNHEVVNGIMSQGRFDSSAILYALIPVGTGNDWIKTYGIPNAIDHAIEIIQNGNYRYQDIGLVTYHKLGKQLSRYFVNVAGMAYDAYICQKAEVEPEAISNRLSYLWLVFRCLFQYKLRKARLLIDGHKKVSGKFYTINVGICKYSGGGMQFVPHAVPDDGQFALTVAGELSRLGVVMNTYRFYNGTIGQHPKVEASYCKTLEVYADEDKPTLLEADGEYLGTTPVHFQLIPKAIKVIVP
jgi:diacylglycerol kinase (ATP)